MPTLIMLFLSGFTLGSSAYSHQGHHQHPGPEAKNPAARATETLDAGAIREGYQRRIEPLFRKSCMDCHSSTTKYPWYHLIPGVRQLIDSDINEARHHLDFSNGYPFVSHASPMEDLDAIAKSIQDGTMPPFLYRASHSNSLLSEGEKNLVLDWVRQSKIAITK